MKFKQIILAGAVLATSTFTSLTNAQAETGFRDVPSDHWSYNAIMGLKEKYCGWLWKRNVWFWG